ncbi:MAG: hypothetical protein ACREAM_23920 [Blastocatellia bacterium]
MKAEKIKCDECDTPVAEMREDGTIIIRVRHHGREHVTILAPAQSKQKNSLVVAGSATAKDCSEKGAQSKQKNSLVAAAPVETTMPSGDLK